MCGISGYFSASFGEQPDVINAMSGLLAHRGPDNCGVWEDRSAGIVLAHRRLSILDLSPAGHQPMESSSGRYIIVYNGEIYNCSDIRAELDRSAHCVWRGHSDTEVMLASIEQWGIGQALPRWNGMFALALWDRQERTLTLIRDRLGEKPLYYGRIGKHFVFGSELKALRAFPGFSADIDQEALFLFLRHGYVPAPLSIYRNIRKLPPGMQLAVHSPESIDNPAPYWSMQTIAHQGLLSPFNGSEKDVLSELERILALTIRRQMIADVPLGAFLSGGIDSSVIVALMQRQASRPVKTFTIGFHENSHNEAHYAKAVARHMGTEHTEFFVTPDDALQVIPKLPIIYDEPFADSSQIPTCLLAALTRQHVTVSLSGDGGDELFGGYDRYFWAIDIWRYIRTVPRAVRSMAGMVASHIKPSVINAITSILPDRYRISNAGDKFHKFLELVDVSTPDELYLKLLSQIKRPEMILNGRPILSQASEGSDGWPSLLHYMMYRDATNYLPDDIMVKVDRASMAVALESRAPYLDHSLIEFAWTLPIHMRIKNRTPKWPLRQILASCIPTELIDRPKMGFAVPINDWLRGPLRQWAEALLDEQRLRQEGFFNPDSVRMLWSQHIGASRNHQYPIWCVLMFQAWKEQWHS